MMVAYDGTPNVQNMNAENRLTLTAGETHALQLQYTFDSELTEMRYAEAIAKQTPIFVSTDEAVATVDALGNIMAIDSGKAVITATVGDVAAKCEVTVIVPVDSVVAADTLDLYINGEGSFNCSCHSSCRGAGGQVIAHQPASNQSILNPIRGRCLFVRNRGIRDLLR